MKIPAAPLHLLLALAATWPTVLTPLTRMIGHPDADVWNHAWGPWWFWQQLGNGLLPWECRQLYGPDGGTLWFIDPVGALFGALFVPLLGIVGAWNLLVIGGVVATSWATRNLATRVTGPGPHTWIASIAIVFGPYLNGELHNGISEAAFMAPAILSLALAHSAFEKRTLGSWIATALALGLTFLSSPYYGLTAGIAIAVWGIRWILSRPGDPALLRAGAGAALTAALVAPVAWLINVSVKAPDALVHRADPEVATLVLEHNRVDPRTFVAPFGFQSVDYMAMGESFLHSGYLGWVVLVLAFLGWRRTRFTAFAVGGLVTALLALGPVLIWGDDPVLIAGRRVLMPFSWLQTFVPIHTISHTLRLAVPGLAVVAVLASAGVRDRPRWLALAIVLVPLDLVFLGGSAWPLARTPVLNTAAQADLAVRSVPKSQRVVLDLPGAVGNSMATSRYLILQTFHGRPIPYRPDARASSASLLEVPSFQILALASESREEHRAKLLTGLDRLRYVDRKGLVDAGVAEVVVHRDLDRGNEHIADTERLLEVMYGAPIVHGETAIYTVAGRGKVRVPKGLLTALKDKP
jgi:hypothetical protein